MTKRDITTNSSTPKLKDGMGWDGMGPGAFRRVQAVFFFFFLEGGGAGLYGGLGFGVQGLAHIGLRFADS